MAQTKRQISKQEAIDKLWRNGVLTWKLDSCQRQMYDLFQASKYRKIVWKCSRRLGKSWALLIIAFEHALKNPGTQIKYACPTAVMAKNIIIPTARKILADCPQDLKPDYVKSDKCFYFNNDSLVQIVGTDEGNAENLRGTESHLSILDEAAFMDDLEYVINDILIPQTLTTRGKIILSSTPPRKPDHPYNKFVAEAKLNNAFIMKTILDAVEDTKNDPDHFKKRFHLDILEEIKASYGGENSPVWRKEFLCFDEDVLINTNEGFKKAKDLEIGNLVLTHIGNYKPITNIIMNPVEDDMIYRIKSGFHEGSLLTKGHKIYVAPKKKWDKLPRTPDWKHIETIKNTSTTTYYSVIPIPKHGNISNISEDLAYLTGWHLAEGRVGISNQAQILSLGFKDPFYEIDNKTLKVWGKRYKVYNKQNACFQAYLCSKEAKSYYSQFGKDCYSKKLPTWLKNSTPNIKKQFLKGLFLGDGCLKSKIQVIDYHSSSLELITDVSEILHSFSILHSIHKSKRKGTSTVIEGRTVNQNDGYIIRIYKNSYKEACSLIYDKEVPEIYKNCRNHKDNNNLYYRITSIKSEIYNKKYVYDFSIQDDHSLVGLFDTFHNCQDTVVDDRLVFPEFDEQTEKAIVKEWGGSQKVDRYVAMDIGLKDFTGVLFGYYDFPQGKLVIEDEMLLNGNKATSKNVAEGIKEKEAGLWTDPINKIFNPPYIRVSDDNLLFINELYMEHKLNFMPTKKDQKEVAIDNVRNKLRAQQIIIHPRCKHLIFQLKTATWAKNRNTFERTEAEGHYDLCDALIYMVRNVQWTKNPYGILQSTVFDMYDTGKRATNHAAEGLKSLFGMKQNK